MKKEIQKEIIPTDIEQQIFVIRGQKVMIDVNLANLYQVPTKRLNEQVKRNSERFPEDFMFQLNKEEMNNLKSQFATSSLEHGGKRKPSYVFTEHGVAMLSSVLKSERAVQMSVFIIRAFIKIRQLMATNQEFKDKLVEIEEIQKDHNDVLVELCETVGKITEDGIRPPGPIGLEPN